VKAIELGFGSNNNQYPQISFGVPACLGSAPCLEDGSTRSLPNTSTVTVTNFVRTYIPSLPPVDTQVIDVSGSYSGALYYSSSPSTYLVVWPAEGVGPDVCGGVGTFGATNGQNTLCTYQPQ